MPTKTFTNFYDVDETIASIIKRDGERPHTDAEFHVTQLIQPGQITYLSSVHPITEDVSDRLWALLGTAVHKLLAENFHENIWPEGHLETEVNSHSVSGTFDIYKFEEKEVQDFKVTSVWAFLLGTKSEWEQQLNLYAALLRREGYEVELLSVSAILRDWQASKKNDDGYPQIPFLRKTIDCWPPERAEEFLVDSVRRAVKAKAGEYPPCTKEERWQRPEKYAVMRVGRKRALKLCDSQGEAVVWINQNQKPGERLTLEYRAGQDVRCESYCPVRDYCPQKKGTFWK